MRCRYCMPEAGIRLAAARVDPLLRGDRPADRVSSPGWALTRSGSPAASRCCATISPRWSRCCACARLRDIALTTNGILLGRHATELASSGPQPGHRQPRHSPDLSGCWSSPGAPRHADVLEGIAAARSAGFACKLNVVVIRGYNDDELGDLIDFGRRRRRGPLHRVHGCRGATDWSMEPGGEPAGDPRDPGSALWTDRAAGQAHAAPAERFSSPTAPSSASSPRPPRPSAGAAIGAALPPTAPGCSASTAKPVSICGKRSGSDAATTRSPSRIAAAWRRPDRPGSRAAGRAARPRGPLPARVSPRRSAPGDAHPGRMMALHIALIQPRSRPTPATSPASALPPTRRSI